MNDGPRDATGDDLPILDPPQRVSGMRVPDGWTLPGKPVGLTAAAEDAWRQSGFLLAEDLRLLGADLDLQVRLAGAGYRASARNMRMAAFASLWSRAFSCTSDAVGLIRRGAYQSALPLLRQAVEHVAAQSQLVSELDEFRVWAHRAYARHAESRSEEIGLGHYFAGEAIAHDEDFRVIYRGASDLGRPNFGPTALFVANEASHIRYPLNFADEAFHLGWGELLFGWALRIGVKQLHFGMHARDSFPAPDALRERVVAHVREAEAHLSDDARCRLEEYVDGEKRRRHLLVQFRRMPPDAAKRLLL
ncbi:MAG: hypothetical protein AB7I38_08340 [Dehalococcoidia bacterium]